jgi:hypothetical protein
MLEKNNTEELIILLFLMYNYYIKETFFLYRKDFNLK